MSVATRLMLLRHAEVEPRYQRIFGGRIDMALSERGQAQAATLAHYLRPKKFDAIYSSPMLRVRQTLAPFLEENGAQPVVLPELREVDFGDWTGLGFAEVHARYGVSAFQWLHQLELDAIPNAESAKTFRARVEPCLQHILRDHSAQSVLVACHGGTIRMILSILLELPLSRMSAFEIEYASLSLVEIIAEKAEVQLLNFTPWRDLHEA